MTWLPAASTLTDWLTGCGLGVRGKADDGDISLPDISFFYMNNVFFYVHLKFDMLLIYHS